MLVRRGYGFTPKGGGVVGRAEVRPSSSTSIPILYSEDEGLGFRAEVSSSDLRDNPEFKDRP